MAMSKACLLITGFEPFGGESINVSWEVARALRGRQIAGRVVKAVCLPTEFGRAGDELDRVLRAYEPSLVLALGQAAGRGELSLERVAINVDDARIPDNAGASPVDEPVVRRGPAAYFSTLPIKAMALAARAAGVPAGVSQSAGTFVCNHLFYRLQHRLRRSDVRSGFMHLPLLPQQADTFVGSPVMALDDQVRGTRAALMAALDHRASGDTRQALGAIA